MLSTDLSNNRGRCEKLLGNTEQASQAERETDLLRTTVATISRSAGKFNYLSTIILIKSFFQVKTTKPSRVCSSSDVKMSCFVSVYVM